MKNDQRSLLTRRDFLKVAGYATLSTGVGVGLASSEPVQAQSKKVSKPSSNGPYNILMIVTDQERHMKVSELPKSFQLPGHERLAKRGVVFENHQIASCVCTPSRSVLYTGQHIQNTGMFDNTNFPWSNDLSTDIDTIGDMLRAEGYYTAYKGKWHLTDEFETVNKLHAPKKILVDEMEEYGFSDYFGIGDTIAHTEGGKPQDLADQGFRPNLKKRGAIRGIYDGQYKFNRYYSPQEHHEPRTIEQLFANNDVELFDLKSDPLEMNNLAIDRKKYGDLILTMNNKLNLLIEHEVGEDVGQILPQGTGADWRLSPELKYLRM